jgi:glycosyltransferase involved in cell wall biosynthesis
VIPPGYLIVLPWPLTGPIGGVNTAVHNLIHEMRADGKYTPILLVSSGLGGAGDRELPTLVRWLREPWDPARGIRAIIGFLTKLPIDLWQLSRLIRTYRVAAVNFHFPTLGCCVFLLMRKLKLFRGLVILTFHGSDIRKAGACAGIERVIWRWVLRTADRVVAGSGYSRNDVLGLEPDCSGHVAIIRNGMDFERLRSEMDTTFVLPAEILNRPIVLNIGRFDRDKARDVLIRAFQQVRRRFPNAVLVCLGGQGAERDSCLQLIRAAGLEQAVFVFDSVPSSRVPVFLKAAQVFALSSRREGGGPTFAIMEAAAFHVPLVTTAAGGIHEVICDRENGRLVPVDDDAALALAICAAIEDRDDSARMADNLYRLVTGTFSARRNYEQYTELLSQ